MTKTRPFVPPEPTLETAHDVRRLKECTHCHHVGTHLLVVNKTARRFAHAYCIVEAEGWQVLASLPEKETNKVAVSDLIAWGMNDRQFLTRLDLLRQMKNATPSI